MLANSWLYHYYSVQSKIQFGLSYDGPARMSPGTPYYHHSPTLQASLSHPYVTTHHMPYGYHSPVGIPPHQGSPGLIGHHNGTIGPPHNAGVASEHYRPYAYRIDTQPVDYSQTTTPVSIPPEPRCSSTNSSNSGSNHIGSPPAKRRTIARLEPLYIPENQESVDNASIELYAEQSESNIDGIGNTGSGGTVLLTTVLPPRHRYHPKGVSLDPTDCMDQWNPSPPWSETAQKVPDIMQQELSPYLTTTPPTPTSAPPITHIPGGPAFSFDWMPEQFVPILDCPPCMPCFTVQDGSQLQVPIPMQLSHWSNDHRIFSVHASEKQQQHSTSPHDDSNGKC